MKRHQFSTLLYLLSVLALGLNCSPVKKGDHQEVAANDASDNDPAGLHKPRGLVHHSDQATPGYVLFTPNMSDQTYLINLQGEVVHTWSSQYSAGGGLYLLPNGNLLRGGREPEVPRFGAGGQGGRLQEISPDGTLVWDYLLATDQYLLHHDVAVLPNGNILAIAYEHITSERGQTLGRKPALLPEEGLWTDVIFELKPIYPDKAEIVWEWRMIDHVVQDADSTFPSYGVISDHPELVDINIGGPLPKRTQADLDKRRANNQLPPNATLKNVGSDLMHSNAINYNVDLDQIVISSPNFNEIWILDHSTTKAQAAGHDGGRWGRGGDILYRWGNPATYGRGQKSDQKLHHQHDVRWIPDGYPGEGRIMVFNNQVPHEESNFSQVIEIEPALDDEGNYLIDDGEPFGPNDPSWAYVAVDTFSFFGSFISGAHRLSNGHTMITSGPQGRFFEIDEDKNTVWEYWSPYPGEVRLPDGSLPQPMGNNIYGVFRATHIPKDHPGLSFLPIE